MKLKTALLAIAVLLALPPMIHAQEQSIPRPKILGVSHAALYCTNLDASRAFFKDYLGFDEPYSANNPDGTLKLTWIKINDLQQIELFPAKNPDDDRLYQVALITDNCEAMRQYLKSKGWKVPDKPVGTGQIGNRNLSVKDPDGHIIEFVEYVGTSWTLKDKGRHMPATRISPRIRHIGFKVADLAASLHFYKDILGCEETWRGSRDNKLLSWVNIRLPDCDEYLELMLYGGPEPKASALGTMNHICLEVPDIQAAYDTLQKRTLPEACKLPTSAPKTGINGKRQINAYDPEGTRIEIMEPNTHDGNPVPSSAAPLPIPDKLKK